MNEKPFPEKPNSSDIRKNRFDSIEGPSHEIGNKPNSKEPIAEEAKNRFSNSDSFQPRSILRPEQPPINQAQDERPQTKMTIVEGRPYFVRYVPKEEIWPAFGYSSGSTAVVREDLTPRVKRFVEQHEIFHCRDNSTFGGWIGSEIRANIDPGMKDPMGLLATIWATITDADRIKFYIKRFGEGR